MSQTNGNRVYRPVEPSDLPKIQEGKLKAFRIQTTNKQQVAFPAHLVSLNYCLGGLCATPCAAYMVDFGVGQGDILCYSNIVVDVTPEVRWIIWNLKYDRLSGYMNENKVGWAAKGDVERFLDAKLGTADFSRRRHHYKIVSFEV